MIEFDFDTSYNILFMKIALYLNKLCLFTIESSFLGEAQGPFCMGPHSPPLGPLSATPPTRPLERGAGLESLPLANFD